MLLNFADGGTNESEYIPLLPRFRPELLNALVKLLCSYNLFFHWLSTTGIMEVSLQIWRKNGFVSEAAVKVNISQFTFTNYLSMFLERGGVHSYEVVLSEHQCRFDLTLPIEQYRIRNLSDCFRLKVLKAYGILLNSLEQCLYLEFGRSCRGRIWRRGLETLIWWILFLK